MSRYMLIRRLRGPAFLLLVGILALLNQAHILSWGQSWPFYLILWGVLLLVERMALTAEDGFAPGPYPGSCAGPHQGPYPGAPYQGSPCQGGVYPGAPYSGTANPSAPVTPSQSPETPGSAIVATPTQALVRDPVDLEGGQG